MLDALKTLFENDVVSAEVRQEIEEAWNKKIKENRLEVTSELREEFAKKYPDKKMFLNDIWNATIVNEGITSEVKYTFVDFTDDEYIFDILYVGL